MSDQLEKLRNQAEATRAGLLKVQGDLSAAEDSLKELDSEAGASKVSLLRIRENALREKLADVSQAIENEQKRLEDLKIKENTRRASELAAKLDADLEAVHAKIVADLLHVIEEVEGAKRLCGLYFEANSKLSTGGSFNNPYRGNIHRSFVLWIDDILKVFLIDGQRRGYLPKVK